MTLLDRCDGSPTRRLSPGEVVLTEGAASSQMYVLASGRLDVVRAGQLVATIAEPGSALGEISVLLDQSPSATVIAREDSTVYVIDDPIAFLSSDPEALFEVARTLAGRLARLSGYLVDVKQQYGDAGGHLGLLDEVISELSFGQQSPADPGSERDPDPLY